MIKKPSEQTIRKNLAALRRTIETEQDPVVVRIAYAMEQAVRWATEETDWSKHPRTLDGDAYAEAKILRQELEASK